MAELSWNCADTSYFESYGDLNIHRLMLLDQPRTSIYKHAIQSNLIKDKVIMDLGAGTGILSFFAAKAGARRIFSIEASDQLCNVIRDIAVANHLQHVIVVINSKIEDIPDLQTLWKYPTVAEQREKNTINGSISNHRLYETRVDVLISEWMGFYLLHEGMLSSVLCARDRFLKSKLEGGIMLPEKASIYLTIGSVPELWHERIGWTEKPFHGLDYSAIRPALLRLDQRAPILIDVPKASVSVASTEKLITFDLWTVQDKDLDYLECDAFVALQQPGSSSRSNDHLSQRKSLENICNDKLHGFILWFDVEFPTLAPMLDECPEFQHLRVILDTSPHSQSTHWKQCVLLFDKPMELIPGLKIQCHSIFLRQKRCYQIVVQVVDVQQD